MLGDFPREKDKHKSGNKLYDAQIKYFVHFFF